jgi:uncharacterized PurR-regulated membrane protein YhhQ (DUF165 family)
MELVAIFYLLARAVMALFNPFVKKGTGIGQYLARFIVCLIATPFYYVVLLAGSTLPQLSPKQDPKRGLQDWVSNHVKY